VTLPKTIRVYQTPSVCSEILNTREELERHAAAGYFPLPEEKHLAANAEPAKPPVNEEGLRLDGPTLEEYVKAGYKAESYPPKGYAAKPSPAGFQATTSGTSLNPQATPDGNLASQPETSSTGNEQPPAPPAQPEAPTGQPEPPKPAPAPENASEKPAGKSGKPPQA
jgi:hypothetical protein